MCLYGIPAVRKPKFRALVTAVIHKSQILAAGRRAHGKAKRLKKDFMARRFVIEMEPADVSANFDQPSRNASALRGGAPTGVVAGLS